MYKSEDIEGLIDALDDADITVKIFSSRALARIGEPAVTPLITALGGRHAPWKVGLILRNIGKPAVGPLIRAIEDEDENIRRNAVVTLRLIGDKIAVKPLINTLGDESTDVKIKAAEALNWIADDHELEPVREILEEITQEPGYRG